MQAAKAKVHISRYMNEDENFWKKHIADFSKSSLKISHYCKVKAINYDRFIYWRNKLTPQPSQDVVAQKILPEKHRPLLPVQLKPEASVHDALLCSLNLRNGEVLKIHDKQALILILERLS